jgi:hypothetical protein
MAAVQLVEHMRRRVPRSPRLNLTLQLGLKEIAAQEEMVKAGYRLPGRPDYEAPRLPLNLSDLSDDDLMRLYAELTQWSDHIGGAVGLAEISERYANSAYELTYATMFAQVMTLSGKSRSESSVTVIKQETVRSYPVMSLQDKRDEIYARRKILSKLYENLERDTNLVSRELTRRLNRDPHERRVGKYI